VPAHEVEPGILLKSLSSLAKQSLAAREYEVVVFDDGSRDSTPQVIQDFIQDKPQFRYFRHERCQGISATRNSAIQEARGSLIALVDADDYLEAKSLERALLFHRKNPDVLYSYSRHIRVNSSGEVLYKVDSRPFDPELLLHINFVAHLKCFSRE